MLIAIHCCNGLIRLAASTSYCKLKRVSNKEVSDLWKVPTPEGNSISGPFTPKELATGLNHLEPKNLRDWIPFSGSLHSTAGQLSNLGYAISLFPKLKLNRNNETLLFCSELKHLEVTLSRMLTYRLE